VASLSDSIFQSELLMSEANFQRHFPQLEGYSFLLVRTDGNVQDAADEFEDALEPFSADAMPVAERLAEFHRVENTYLSTFQMLGGLGLLLGTAGLAAVLLRNILERRRELALLRALGYQPRHFFIMTLMENGFLLAGGLLAGFFCALVAIAPAVMERGGRLPAPALLALLGAVAVLGLALSILSTAAALREGVLTALRSE
jgi:ABC-type antimicrobial peptide transport system permease subunit